MSQSSSDGAFWSASVSEGYYSCEGDYDLDPCKYYSADDAIFKANPETASDWVTPYADDDPTDFWCTKANTTIGAALSPYECTALQCVIERDLDTGNVDEDFRFTPTAT